MADRLSNELLYGIANHLDLLHLIRDASITSLAVLKEQYRNIVNICLASKRFFQIFYHLIEHVILDNGGIIERTELVKRFLADPQKARKIRALSSLPAALPSDNLVLGLDPYPSYLAHVTNLKLPYTIKALGSLLSLLPELEFLQLGVHTQLSMDYQGVLQLFQQARRDNRILPKLKSITICFLNEAQPGFHPLGIQDIFNLPRLEELNATNFCTPYDRRDEPLLNQLQATTSKIKTLRLLSCDIDHRALKHLVASMINLEELELQWSPEGQSRLPTSTRHLASTLRTQAASLKRITLDAKAAEWLETPDATILPAGSFVDFRVLNYMELPAVLLSGRTPAPYNDAAFVEAFRDSFKDWMEKQQSGRRGNVYDNKPSPDEDWDFLTAVLPVSLTTLVIQSPKHPWNIGRVVQWIQHFVTTRLEHHPNLRTLDLSQWKSQYLDTFFESCNDGLFDSRLSNCKTVLKLSLDSDLRHARVGWGKNKIGDER
jgi:hypothetical protein